jgi:hypothetical protein
MNTFRTSAEITPEHRLVVALPLEMPIGTAEVVTTVAPGAAAPANGAPAARGSFREQFGAVRGGDPNAADNDRIDAELADADLQTGG